jgi:hypothetical protein
MMKVELESTTKIVEIMIDRERTVPARIWEGKTESGIPIHAFITRIAVDETENQKEFESELQSHKTPSLVIEQYPLRIIL